MASQSHKFRPYLTPPELETIINSLKTTCSNPHLIHYLEGFKGKIDLGITSPNLTLTPKVGMMERLGLNEPDLDSLTLTPIDKRLQAYNKWAKDPAKCSPKEIEFCHIYRFENDLMSPEEEQIYLESQGG
jgi:hypothetical protein